MNTNMQGHNHGGKSHLYGMVGIGALVLVVLLFAGKSFGEALPLAALLACPLMMIGMMFMMRGGNNGHQHDNNAPTDHHDHAAPAPWSDETGFTAPRASKPAERN
ncbi:DUF2933 domain-containing protein [Pengzhenrongella frigida]|uniref:DUF2933 domain-containing protein n=1 Tax=Pengzhenrongella frigida TaxID=1259133 RepID=A0A4Q5MXN2_9MICO|nr:DUF2933 domain-containing protein [Cellulomonas sp. HLT2-17]RYV49703.1 DUF2933 domain-containing protein [Cellulomonas sp. HLT2-17]